MENKVGLTWRHKAKIAVAWLVAVIVVMPFIWMIMLSFKTNSEILLSPASIPQTIRLDNYINALNTLPLAMMCYNTFINIAITMLLTLAIVYPCSYALARIPFKSKRLSNAIYSFFLAGLMVPVYILLFPIYKVNMGLGIINTRLSLILPIVATNISFDTLLLVGALRETPKEIEESAIIDGSGIFGLCVRISAPLIVPTLVTIIVFNVLYVWNEYLFTSLFLTDRSMITLSMGISLFQGQYSMDYAGMIAATVLVMIPQMLFYALFQKKIIKGLMSGAVKG